MAELKVTDIEVDKKDSAGVMIDVVYVKNAPHYAIYGTAAGVQVHFADDPQEKAEQQQLLAALNPLRSEVDSLIDGWREAGTQDEIALTKLYDRRIKNALAATLQNDIAGAQALLKGTLDAIAEERQSRGRIEHLRFAAFTAGAVAGLALLAYLIWGSRLGALVSDLNALAFAAAIGAVGAITSIGIKVQDRSLTTDLQSRDNIIDAILRVSVGAVGAILLIAMLRSDLIDLEVGSLDLGPLTGAPAEQGVNNGKTASDRTGGGAGPRAQTGTGSSPTVAGESGNLVASSGNGLAATPGTDANALAETPPATGNSVAPSPSGDQASPGGSDEGGTRTGKGRLIDGSSADLLVVLIVAFFAGFTERLVSQLANRFRFRDVAAQAVAGTGAPAGGGVRPVNPGVPAGGGTGGPAEAPDGDDDATDGCIADVSLGADQLTDNSELPEATGGVEEARP